MREALAKFNDVRIQFFAEQADLHYVMANNDDDKKEINVVKTKLVALQSLSLGTATFMNFLL